MEKRGGREGERAVLYGIVVDFVCAWGAQRAPLALARGPIQHRVCMAKLSGEGGHSWLGHDALKVPPSTSSVKSNILALQLHEATQKPYQNEH